MKRLLCYSPLCTKACLDMDTHMLASTSLWRRVCKNGSCRPTKTIQICKLLVWCEIKCSVALHATRTWPIGDPAFLE